MKQDIPVIILAGGFGTRLRSVDATRPKPMVLIKNKPFLFWLVRHLESQGFTDFLISTGYKAEMIEDYPFHDYFKKSRFRFYREDTPLGTGGAVRQIFQQEPTMESAWIVNGDTLLESNLPVINALDWHRDHRQALFTVLENNNVFDAKPNLVTQGKLVLKEGIGGDKFDAGAVLIKRSAFINPETHHQQPPFSLHVLLNYAMTSGHVEYIQIPGLCYDIGTPERFKRFEGTLPDFT